MCSGKLCRDSAAGAIPNYMVSYKPVVSTGSRLTKKGYHSLRLSRTNYARCNTRSPLQRSHDKEEFHLPDRQLFEVSSIAVHAECQASNSKPTRH